MNIEGTTVLVTGGAAGLGLATVRALRARGANVGALDMADGSPAELRDDDGIHFIKTDVTNEAAVASAIRTIAQKFGSIDACVNCAGVFHSTPVIGPEGVHPLAVFRRVVDINLTGTFAVLSRAAEQMVRNAGRDADRECGVIINVASIRAFDGGPGGAAYAASKGAVVAMTLALARDLAPQRIRANTIAPGLMNTDMFNNLTPEAIASHSEKVPFPKRLGDPEEFASLVCHLIENRYINGETIRIDAALRV